MEDNEEVVVINDNENTSNSDLVNKYLLGEGKPVKKIEEDEEEIQIINDNEEDILTKYNLNLPVETEDIPVEIEEENEDIPVEIEEDIPVEIEETQQDIPIEIEENTPIDIKKNIEDIKVEEEYIPTEENNEDTLMTPIELGTVNNEFNPYEEINNIVKEEYDSNIFNNKKEEQKPEMIIKKPEPKRIIITILILLVLVLLSVCSVLYIFNSNHKTVINKSITHLLEYRQYIEKPFILNNSKERSLKGNLKLKISDDYKKLYPAGSNKYNYYDALNNMNITYNMLRNNEKVNYDMDVKVHNINKLGLTINANTKTGYLLLKDVYDKYLEIESLSGLVNSRNNVKYEDYKEFYDFCYDSFFKHLNKEKYKSENARILLEEKEVNAKKTSLILEEKDIVELYNKVIEDVGKNQKENDFIKRITGKNANELDLAKVKNEETPYTIEYDVYTKGIMGDIVGIDLNIEHKYKAYSYSWNDLVGDSYNSKNYSIKSSKTSYIYRNETKPSLTIKENDNIKSIIVASFENNNIILELFDENKKSVGNISVKNENDKYIINYKQSDDSQEADYNIEINYKENKKNEDYDVNIIGKFEIKDVYYDTEATNLEIKAKYNIKNGLEGPIKDVNKSVKYDKLSEEEKDQIIFDGLMKFINVFGFDMNQNPNTDELPSLLNFQK